MWPSAHCGGLSPGALRKDPEPEEEVPDIKLDWQDVKAEQGMKRSVWANLKRAAT